MVINHLLTGVILQVGGGFKSFLCLPEPWGNDPIFTGLLRGGVPRGGGSLIFPKVPQSSLGILRVPYLPPPPLNTPPLGTYKN